jgi:hypothetical protein
MRLFQETAEGKIGSKEIFINLKLLQLVKVRKLFLKTILWAKTRTKWKKTKTNKDKHIEK